MSKAKRIINRENKINKRKKILKHFRPSYYQNVPDGMHADHQKGIGCPDGRKCTICHSKKRLLSRQEININLEINEVIKNNLDSICDRCSKPISIDEAINHPEAGTICDDCACCLEDEKKESQNE